MRASATSKTRGSRKLSRTRYSLRPKSLPPPAWATPEGRRLSAREEVHRAVRAPEVLPADLEEAAPGQLQPLARLAARRVLPQVAADLDAGAIADRRRRRLLDGDDQVTLRFAALADVGHGDATEQAERAQAALALEDLGEAERVARLQRQSPLDRRRWRCGGCRRRGCARPAPACPGRRRRPMSTAGWPVTGVTVDMNAGAIVAPVEEHRRQRVAIGRDERLVEGRARGQRQLGAQVGLGHAGYPARRTAPTRTRAPSATKSRTSTSPPRPTCAAAVAASRSSIVTSMRTSR